MQECSKKKAFLFFFCILILFVSSSTSVFGLICRTGAVNYTTVSGGGGAGDKWVDGGSYIYPNTTFADNVIVFGYVYAEDWSNISITTDQVSNYSMGAGITDTNATTECSGAEVLLGNSSCVPYYEDTDTDTQLSQEEVFGFVNNDTFFPYWNITQLIKTLNTNASTECSGATVLVGNGSCVPYYEDTDTDTHKDWSDAINNNISILADNLTLNISQVNDTLHNLDLFNFSNNDTFVPIWNYSNDIIFTMVNNKTFVEYYNFTSIVDTNASACGADELLSGDNACVDYSGWDQNSGDDFDGDYTSLTNKPDFDNTIEGNQTETYDNVNDDVDVNFSVRVFENSTLCEKLTGSADLCDGSDADTDTWNTTEEIFTVCNNDTWLPLWNHSFSTNQDGNASSICNGATVLLGNGTCNPYYEDTDTQLTQEQVFGYVNNDTFVPLWNVTDIILEYNYSCEQLTGSADLCDGGDANTQLTSQQVFDYVNNDTFFPIWNMTFVTDTDTNASTACSGATVLVGNGSCIPYYEDTDTDTWNTTEEIFVAVNNDTYVALWNVTSIILQYNYSCEQLTGSSELCDGDDAVGEGATPDGNASSICSGATVLAGNGSCVPYYDSSIDTDTDTWNTTEEIFNAVNNNTYLALWNFTSLYTHYNHTCEVPQC
jgi:hypothetical protein